MTAYELTYLGKARIHEGTDAPTVYFRVLQAGAYIGAFAAAIPGAEASSLVPRPDDRFWRALAGAATNAIGTSLMTQRRTPGDSRMVTLWVRAGAVAAMLDHPIPDPAPDAVYRVLELVPTS